MMLATTRLSPATRRRSAFTLIEVLVVVAILVILATIAAVAVPKQIEEAKKGKAQLGCKSIETAIESYQLSTSNPGLTDEEKMPTSITDLYQPPWGAASFLKDGQSNTIDPWGKPYQFERRSRTDGTAYVFVFTHAPDAANTRISQYGVGPNSEPRN
ncbi:prepilin-type N-terminal cleavage/methylation domain-containing protein [Gemmata sp. G18]|uniref:Prepilin-type N-terminal cleavage/methylation domain-containing protein n=1 Tax=Gemmata palustris TaxID=2822762 RepID=A0ABS5C2V5_9BACT|nr:prepilin-type N-terminal cleavage/methylation domain-containing protein [Gemmata palustris]MBP3959473.1 prepilin-type N-terminal cleavage/methylation domain-containing protein [Gemmata palustris]